MSCGGSSGLLGNSVGLVVLLGGGGGGGGGITIVLVGADVGLGLVVGFGVGATPGAGIAVTVGRGVSTWLVRCADAAETISIQVANIIHAELFTLIYIDRLNITLFPDL